MALAGEHEHAIRRPNTVDILDQHALRNNLHHM